MSKSKQFTVLLSIFLLYTTAECRHINIEGYYWREYAGVIPSDALPGGSDHNGDPIYIGQVLDGNKLITAKLYENDKKAYYGLDEKEHTSTENIKILCTQYPDRFQWISTNSNGIHLLTDHHLVLGGFEPGYTMYIGRAYYKQETAVGKVSTGKTKNLGLYITHGGEEVNLDSFEILTYKPNTSRIE